MTPKFISILGKTIEDSPGFFVLLAMMIISNFIALFLHMPLQAYYFLQGILWGALACYWLPLRYYQTKEKLQRDNDFVIWRNSVDEKLDTLNEVVNIKLDRIIDAVNVKNKN